MAHTEPLKQAPSISSLPGVRSAPQPPSDTGRAARTGLWVLGLGLGGFLLWAAVAPLDEGVPSQGVVAIDTKRKAVQHLSGGIVKQVFVREGDVVQAGQPLISLDDAVAKANYEAVRQRYLGLRAVQGRLLAEQSGAATIVFHSDLQVAAADPLIQQQMKNQEQLIQSRRAALRADLQGIEESIQGQNALLQAYAGMLTSRRGQQASLEEELRHTRELVKEGYSPRNRQLELERMVADSSLAITELLGNTARTQRTVREMRQRALARQQEYRKEVETNLADITREVQSDADKFTALKADLDRTEIRAPATGQVVGLAVQTVGAVVQAGQQLMGIVPPNEPLVLEARIAPHLIDKVRPGLHADVRFSAFAHSPQLVVQGELASVFGDLLTDAQSNQTYYLARVKVTPDGMKTLGERHLQPGMPAEVVIKTGERTMLTYLLGPLLKRVSGSLKEE
ncbi:HlyD family type I secretion periplasmic adaptor subunit [Acidovorax sp.]|uniref:HlyD family type I secretion periplasmic adaptor subunit n=1 Tax=Acidovorax sp. TaxID=1872122 RepID=UPI0025BE7FD6|nr:HlyD family type I secretion periplasmic adaptor subunit [Acidovorax sp.]MBL7088163.1 HlyD family type I secretion periplasmic adaptor subunit [Acidovorax sp.]